MSAVTFGLELGEYLPGPDFNVKNLRSGGATGSQSFVMTRATWAQIRSDTFAQGTRASELDPNNASRGGDSLTLDSTTTADQPGGFVKVIAAFAGWSTEAQEGTKTIEPVYERSGTLVQRDIMEHPRIQAITGATADQDKFILSQCVLGNWFWYEPNSELGYFYLDSDENQQVGTAPIQPTDAVAITFSKLISKGWLSYESPHTTWTKTWDDDSGIPQATLNQLGIIDVPDGSPAKPTGTDWKLDEATETNMGGLYHNRTTHTLSNPGGWEAEVYDNWI